ncbi:MAG TPA: sensor histidine kinase [Polyangiaceae bacterium]|nr:sensor histidine kinase [Polyangiaceae bacterium]
MNRVNREAKLDNNSQNAAVTLAAAHARLAQWALAVYVGTAVVVASLLIAVLVTEEAHDEEQLENSMRMAAIDRSYALRRYLDLLTTELGRLASRAEIQAQDNDSSPERELLEIAHKRSTLFDVGVAILDLEGAVVWAEPHAFLPQGTSFKSAPWFPDISRSRETRIVSVNPGHENSLLYVVTPAIRDGKVGGVVLGAIDLAKRHFGSNQDGISSAVTLIATRDGNFAYPPTPPALARDGKLGAWVAGGNGPLEARLWLNRDKWVVASAPLPGTDLVYVLAAQDGVLFGKARQRMYVRTAVGLLLVIPPLFMLVLMLRRALRVFRQSEQETVERERLQVLADASNLIAHEVRNALNGLGVGLDLLLKGDRGAQQGREGRIVRQLRDEMQRLSEFTGELMLFSKGIVPHPVRLDLADTVPKLTELSLDLASEAGCKIDVRVERSPVWTNADPTLLRVVLGNLIGNALDVLAAHAPPSGGLVRILLEADDKQARLHVTDDGPGVPEAFRSHLFEPFQTTKPSGTGLGLALSRRIARAHGGDLVLEASSSGASFLLTLPTETP